MIWMGGWIWRTEKGRIEEREGAGGGGEVEGKRSRVMRKRMRMRTRSWERTRLGCCRNEGTRSLESRKVRSTLIILSR